MARTKDPHAAAIKSWETRRRNQRDDKSWSAALAFATEAARTGTGQGSSPTTSSGDWAQDQIKNPPFILGAQHRPGDINRYLAKAGAVVMSGSPLPSDVMPAPPGQCYENASVLVMRNPERFDYMEGVAGAHGMPFLHAWAVDKKTGKVVDPTWLQPGSEKIPGQLTYYGVRYDRKKYFRYLSKTKMWGILGGHPTAAETVMEDGGL